MHAVELTSVPTENRAVVVVHGLDLVHAPHLNSDLDWIQRAGVFTLRYPLVLSASIVLECLNTKCEHSQRFNLFSQSNSAADLGEGPGTPCPLHISGSGCPPPLSQGVDPALKLTRS